MSEGVVVKCVYNIFESDFLFILAMAWQMIFLHGRERKVYGI